MKISGGYLAPFAYLPAADHAVQHERVGRRELLGGLAGLKHRDRAGTVRERPQGKQFPALHKLGVPGLMRREVLGCEREVAALVEKDVAQSLAHIGPPPLPRASRGKHSSERMH